MKTELLIPKEKKDFVPGLYKLDSTDAVFLFECEGKGACVVPGECLTIGYHSISLNMNDFTRLPPGTRLTLIQE